MSETFKSICRLVDAGSVRVSDHGYDELAADGILARDVVAGVAAGTVVEDYPRYPKGPCVLALQTTGDGSIIHVVWVFLRGNLNRPSSLPLTDPIPTNGKMDS